MAAGDLPRVPAPVRPLVRAARAAGWTIEPVGKATLVYWYTPAGQRVLTTNQRSRFPEVAAGLRRNGLHLTGPGRR